MGELVLIVFIQSLCYINNFHPKVWFDCFGNLDSKCLNNFNEIIHQVSEAGFKYISVLLHQELNATWPAAAHSVGWIDFCGQSWQPNINLHHCKLMCRTASWILKTYFISHLSQNNLFLTWRYPISHVLSTLSMCNIVVRVLTNHGSRKCAVCIPHLCRSGFCIILIHVIL